jgi:hypothetical protein
MNEWWRSFRCHHHTNLNNPFFSSCGINALHIHHAAAATKQLAAGRTMAQCARGTIDFAKKTQP